MNRPIWGAVLFGLAVTVVGCSDSGQKGTTTEKTATEGSQAVAEATAEHPATPAVSRNIPKRPSLEGRWVLMFYQKRSGVEVPAALVDISKSAKDGKLVAKVMQFGAALSSTTL